MWLPLSTDAPSPTEITEMTQEQIKTFEEYEGIVRTAGYIVANFGDESVGGTLELLIEDSVTTLCLLPGWESDATSKSLIFLASLLNLSVIQVSPQGLLPLYCECALSVGYYKETAEPIPVIQDEEKEPDIGEEDYEDLALRYGAGS